MEKEADDIVSMSVRMPIGYYDNFEITDDLLEDLKFSQHEL
jgi:DNA/RNA-binding domain of Phe-tRNA-synthetase-like protein